MLVAVDMDDFIEYGLELSGGELERLMRISMKVIGPVSDFAKTVSQNMPLDVRGDAPEEFVEHSIRMAGALVVAEIFRSIPGFGPEVHAQEWELVGKLDHENFALHATPNVMMALATGDFKNCNEEEIERVLIAIFLLNPEMIMEGMKRAMSQFESDKSPTQEGGFHAN